MAEISERISPLTLPRGKAGRINLLPVPMTEIPSESPASWLLFVGQYSDIIVSDANQELVQKYMLLHKTEALTDGEYFFTLTGDRLAYCDPKPFQKRLFDPALLKITTGPEDYSF